MSFFIIGILSCTNDNQSYCDLVQNKINEQEFRGSVINKEKQRCWNYTIKEEKGYNFEIFLLDAELVDYLEVGDSIVKQKMSSFVMVKKQEENKWCKKKYLYIKKDCTPARASKKQQR